MIDTTPQSESRSVYRHWIGLGLLVVAQAGIGLCSAEYLLRNSEAAGSTLIMGVFISQPMLFAFWAALTSQRFYNRLLWGFLVCTLVCFVEELGRLRYTSNGVGGMMIASLTLFALATVLLSTIRWKSCWQIRHTLVELADSGYRGSQFGIKHLISLITVTAIACGLIRSLVIMRDEGPYPLSWAAYFGGTLMFVCALLPVAAIPWFVMAHRARIIPLSLRVVAIWITCDLAAYFIFGAMFPVAAAASVFKELVRPMLLIQLGAGLSVLMSSLVMRFCGFRMVRMPKQRA